MPRRTGVRERLPCTTHKCCEGQDVRERPQGTASEPAPSKIDSPHARVAKLVDARDLKAVELVNNISTLLELCNHLLNPFPHFFNALLTISNVSPRRCAYLLVTDKLLWPRMSLIVVKGISGFFASQDA